MENGHSSVVTPDTLGTLALLGRGHGGYGGYGGYGGGGYGGGGYGGGHSFANDSSNAIRINSNRHLAHQSHDALSQQISDNGDRNRDITNLMDHNANSNRLVDKINDSNSVNAANFNTLQRELAANAREAAACCCEQKLLSVQNQAKTDAGLAEILANQNCVSKVSDAVANAEQNAKLDIILADRKRH